MKYKLTLVSLVLLAITGLGVMVTPAVYAAGAGDAILDGAGQTGDAADSPEIDQVIANISNILLFIVGAVGVIMIIIGGLKYVTSQGDSSAMQSAKNTILYAVIGIIVAIIAYAIVDLVVEAMTA